MIIVLIGAPGSGKGTQGNIIAKKLNIPFVSIGDVLRQMISNNDAIGLSIKSYMDKGELAPTELVNEVVRKFLSTDANKNGCVLDGYPRNLGQVEVLNKMGFKDIRIIFFDVEDKLVLERIGGRFSCAKCGQIYNSYSVKPKIENICDVCGANSFTYRKDDDLEAVKHRLEVYRAETQPVINYYKTSGEFYNIDANKSMDQVEESIGKALKMI